MGISITTIGAIIAVIIVLKVCKKIVSKIIGIAIILCIAAYVLTTLGII